MISDIDKYVDFLTKHSITADQFLILWLIHTKDSKNISRCINLRNPSQVMWDIRDLETKRLLEFSKENTAIVDMQVTEKFSKAVIIDEDDAYEELCSVYPKWMEVKGVKWPMIKGDPIENAKDYYKAFKGNRLIHEEIMSITIAYHKNRPPLSNIIDYIKNRRWNLLKEEVNKSSGSKDSFQTL